MNGFQDTKTGSRRSTGEFFTESSLAKNVGDKILSFINPTCLIEPFAGDGALLQPFLSKNIPCVINDVNPKNYAELKKKFTSNNVNIFNTDFITCKNSVIQSIWLQSVLLYTNPPFSTVSTNSLASKKSEYKDSKSRNLSIMYADLEQYGKGDLILPALGKIIELLKTMNHGFFAFYSPLGLFCKRKRYIKVLNALLKDFTFIWGEIFSGKLFNNVSKSKPIVISLWEFRADTNTNITSIKFHYKDSVIPLIPVPLLKEYWRYDTRKRIYGEIAVQGNDRFNVVAPKLFHIKVEKGGSEVVPENLVKALDIGLIPDELALALWSVVVGYRSLTTYPLYVDNAYVHIPDFSTKEVQKILMLTSLSVIITEELNHYTNGKIKIEKDSGSIMFGNSSLTQGVIYLFHEFKYEKVGEENISDILKKLSSKSNLDKDIKRWRKLLKEKIEGLLQGIGYWDFIPLPQVSRKL